MPDWKDLVEFQQMQSQGAAGIDKEVVKHMLNLEEGLNSKNHFTPEERNMLVLLELADRELGIDTKQFRIDFMQDQLSLAGFNRRSLERMISPDNALAQPIK